MVNCTKFFIFKKCFPQRFNTILVYFGISFDIATFKNFQGVHIFVLGLAVMHQSKQIYKVLESQEEIYSIVGVELANVKKDKAVRSLSKPFFAIMQNLDCLMHMFFS